MLKKLTLLILVCACSMSAASDKSGHAKAAEFRKRADKVRMVTLGDRELEVVQKAHELATRDNVQAPRVAEQVTRVAAGNREITRDEFNELMNEAYEQLGRDSELVV